MGTSPARSWSITCLLLLSALAAPALAQQQVWEDDTFDNLNLGALAGQSGWVKVAGRGSAMVVAWPQRGQVLEVQGQPQFPIIMGKQVPPYSSGFHVLEFDVLVRNAEFPSVAKIEVQTNPRLGEVGKWANKKFQIYFGSSIRLNYGPSGDAVLLVPVTENERWYHVRADFSLLDEVVAVEVDGTRVVSGLPIGRGPLVSLGLSGWDRTDEDPDPQDGSGWAFLDNLLGYTTTMPSGNVWCVQLSGSPTGPPCNNPDALTPGLWGQRSCPEQWHNGSCRRHHHLDSAANRRAHSRW